MMEYNIFWYIAGVITGSIIGSVYYGRKLQRKWKEDFYKRIREYEDLSDESMMRIIKSTIECSKDDKVKKLIDFTGDR